MEEQNHIGDRHNAHHESANETTSPKKTSSSHHSPTKTKHNDDGVVKNHHSKSKEHTKSSSGTPKHKDSTSVKHKDGSSVKHKDGTVRPKDPHVKHKDASLKQKSSSLKPNDHNSKQRDHKDPSAKPRDPNVKSSDPNKVTDTNRPRDSSKHKDPSLKPKDPSVKHKDPSMKPKDPSLKPKDSSLKPKDPSIKQKDPSSKDPNARPKDPSLKHKDPSSKSKDPSVKPRDHNAKPKDPNSKPKDPSVKPRDPSFKPQDPSLKHKDPKIKPKDPSSKSKNSDSKLHSPRPSDSSKPRPKDPNRKENHVRRKDGTIKKSSSSSDPNRHSSSSKTPLKPGIGDSKHVKMEKRPEGIKGDVNRDVQSKQQGSPQKVIKQEGEQFTVKTEKHVATGSPEKVKKEKDTDKVKSPSPVKTVKEEPESDEDEKPLNQRLQEKVKRPLSESEDDEPLTARIEKVKKKRKSESDDEFVDEKPRKRKKELEDEDYDDTPQPRKKKKKDDSKKKKKKKGSESSKDAKPAKKKKKEEEIEVWKWWEEEPLPEGVRWRFLEHKGPVFAPPYEPLPAKVKFYYDGNHVVLSEETEEVAGFYARMLDHDYTTKEIFNKNFFRDWRKTMNKEEQALITDLKKCDFTRMHKYFLEQAEIRKNRTKEEKQALKEANEKITEEFGFCNIDGHKEKIGNFKIEPPGLFRGRGDHPKMGMLKKRIQPEQITINCSKDSVIPKAPEGHRWKAVTHDDSVTWLVSWTENIQGSNKYIMLNPSSRLKGEKDWMKYETARKLKKSVDRIRDDYRADWKSKEMRIRQRAVALYFIDKLALRAGNEKEEGETADTVGCCSLRVEHIKLHEQDNDQEFVVEFDFLGKDSIRYTNKVAVEKRVFKNLQLFIENKQGEDDLFDRLNTSILNKYLQDLMPGLTAKVFRTYNASITLQNQLKALTVPEDSIPSKILAYNRANRAVAVLCNHQRAAPKTFDKQMANLKEKVKAKMTAIKEAKKDLKNVKQEYKKSGNDKMKLLVDRKKKAVDRLEEQLSKLEMQATDKEENKEIALGTSKLNYLDPRISVAWCKKWEVPIEKVYNRTQRDKFRWAIDMADQDYVF